MNRKNYKGDKKSPFVNYTQILYNKDTEKKGEVRVLIGIIFAVLLILFVGITKIKGRYTLGFVTAFFSVVLLLFSMMLYITKMMVYRYFFQIEFVIYRFISNIKISFYDIKWILIIAVVIFQLAMVLVTVRDVYTALFCALCGDEPCVYFHKFHRCFGVYLHRREQKSCVCKHFAAVYSALRNGVYAHFFALSLHFDYAELFFDGASFQKESPESDFRGDTAFADFICFSHSLYTA